MLDVKQIGLNILNLRKRNDMTQVELANMINISHQAVSKWERGVCLPDIELLLHIAEIFSVKVDDLIHDQDSPIIPVRTDMTTSNERNGAKIWEDVLDVIKNQISTPSFNTWFKQTTAQLDGTSLIIYASNPFSTQWLDNRYSSMIKKAVDQVTGNANLKIIFESLNVWNAAPTICT